MDDFSNFCLPHETGTAYRAVQPAVSFAHFPTCNNFAKVIEDSRVWGEKMIPFSDEPVYWRGIPVSHSPALPASSRESLPRMKFRAALLTVLGLALAGCSTVSVSNDPLSARWVGQEAGKFFAAYGPPTSDEEGASSTTYVWRGGYKTTRVAAQYSGEGKDRKLVSRARTVYLVCQVKLVVGEDYRIRSIHAMVDRPDPDGGASWCEKTLDAKK
jgi:hypothetical protein